MKEPIPPEPPLRIDIIGIIFVVTLGGMIPLVVLLEYPPALVLSTLSLSSEQFTRYFAVPSVSLLGLSIIFLWRYLSTDPHEAEEYNRAYAIYQVALKEYERYKEVEKEMKEEKYKKRERKILEKMKKKLP